MGQNEVYALLKQKGEMDSSELIKCLQGKCNSKSINHALRVMKDHNEIKVENKGFRKRSYKLA